MFAEMMTASADGNVAFAFNIFFFHSVMSSFFMGPKGNIHMTRATTALLACLVPAAEDKSVFTMTTSGHNVM